MSRNDFEKLAMAHLDAVYRMAMVLARDENKASDLAAATYLRALRTSDRIERRGDAVRLWLFQILHDLFFSAADGAQRPTPEEPQPEDDTAPDNDAAPDDPAQRASPADVDREGADRRLRATIAALSPEHRVVLFLWAVEGLGPREIAAIRKAPIGAVMRQLDRLKRLVADSRAPSSSRASGSNGSAARKYAEDRGIPGHTDVFDVLNRNANWIRELVGTDSRRDAQRDPM